MGGLLLWSVMVWLWMIAGYRVGRGRRREVAVVFAVPAAIVTYYLVLVWFYA